MTKTIPLDEAFDKEIRDFVTDKLSDNIGLRFYGSDLASELTNNELGMPINPFDSPAKYTFFMLDFGVRHILSESPTLDRLWDEEFELTSEIARRIVSDIEDKTACPAW